MAFIKSKLNNSEFNVYHWMFHNVSNWIPYFGQQLLLAGTLKSEKLHVCNLDPTCATIDRMQMLASMVQYSFQQSFLCIIVVLLAMVGIRPGLPYSLCSSLPFKYRAAPFYMRTLHSLFSFSPVNIPVQEPGEGINGGENVLVLR